uniref:F-box domain-containing protein n=1 Tax=Skeletonema marinoi TaxID=267567 RepID=A0A6U3VEN5_9STRA|mmetsp:Transcript_22473/g.38318  ORF Transcript_22473/g.38318 Transcript_22473/m.38318 type:complete len:440 (+) Transcript_22473:2176-3495(+)
MPSSKKPRLLGPSAADDSLPPPQLLSNVNDLSTDIIEMVLGNLSPQDIMRARVCRKWRQAARNTIVPLPLTEFKIDSARQYNAMEAMATSLPNLQQIAFHSLDYPEEHKYNDGGDPYEHEAVRTANYVTHDIGVVSNFTKLIDLTIWAAPLNGRYPILFNSFPLLESLKISNCGCLIWHLDYLVSCPVLKELYCEGTPVQGNINCLRVLKDTLESISIGETLVGTHMIEGNLMDLADFPHLKDLFMFTVDRVKGDIRDIGENDFPMLEELDLSCCKAIIGSQHYSFQRISDVPAFMNDVHRLLKRNIMNDRCQWSLSEDQSPDWYEAEVNNNEDEEIPGPPFDIRLVQAGSRLGWAWGFHTYIGDDSPCDSCEINWLDPEPDRDSSDYENYIQELQAIEGGEDFFNSSDQICQINFFRGCYQPPTEEEYKRLRREYNTD